MTSPASAERGERLLNTVHCCDMQAFMQSLQANSVDLIFTDPPYNRASVPLFGQLAAESARVLKPGGFCLSMSGGLYQDEILSSMAQSLVFYWTFHVYLSASKTGAVHPGGNHTPVVTRVKPIHAFVKEWGAPRTVIYDPFSGDGNDKRFHHWGQDEKSARYYIDCFTKEGDLVVDPFCGGGTTPFVCQALKRNFIAADSDPMAVEVTQARIRNPLFIPQKDQQLIFEFAK